jgi:hypothetical protein
MSQSDIQAGARWSEEIALRLEACSVGIICLTPDNLDSPWLLFEAGALSKTLEETYVCPYLFALEPSDVSGPLAQFQSSRADEPGTRDLVFTINQALGEQAMDESGMEEVFRVWWPHLEQRL